MVFLRGKIAIRMMILLVFCTQADALAVQGVAEWMEALRPLTRGPFEPPSQPPVATVEFLPQKTEFTATAKAELDALASAMTSSRWHAYLFEIGWHASLEAPPTLSEQRAAALYAYLLDRRGISKARLALRQLPAIPRELGLALPFDTLAIKVDNLGRE